MVMGRRTFDSLPGLLPGRRHIILTRNRNRCVPGAECAHGVGDAIQLAGREPISVIGGSDIFALFLPLADRIELTEILANVDGDTSIPDPRHSADWREMWSEEHPADGDSPAFRFVTLERG